jgi:hypothetical protein
LVALTWKYFSEFFRNLQLIRVPFLDEVLLNLGIPMMRNLETLKIIQCPLLHVGKTRHLLKLIQEDRPKGKEDQVQLEFRPQFHLGPVKIPGNPYIVGSYGVTWDSFNFGDSTIAIWALCWQDLRRARSQGLHWERKGSLFRQWLEQGPCPKVRETLKVLLDGKATPAELSAWVDYKTYHGNPQKVSETNPYTKDSGKW